MKNDREKTYNQITQACFLLNASLYALDNLTQTDLFQHSLKYKINGLSKDLEKVLTSPMKSAIETDEVAFHKFLGALEGIAEKLSKCSVHDLEKISEKIDTFVIKDSDHE